MPRPQKPPRKRSYGKGTVYQRSDGLWIAAAELPRSAEGKRQRVYATGATEAEAIAERDRRLAAYGVAGKAPEKQTLSQYLDTWLAQVIVPHREPKTVELHRWAITTHIIPAIGGVLLTDLHPSHCQAMLNRLMAKGRHAGKTLSPRTIQLVRNTLRAALNDAVEWGYLAKNPVLPVKLPSVRAPELTPYSAEEVLTLYQAIQDDPLRAFSTLLAALGLRPSEALALRWSEVDLRTQTVSIRYNLQRVNGVLSLKRLKTAESRQQLPLPGFVAEALLDHRKRQTAARLKAGPSWQDHDLVFTTHTGGPLMIGNVREDWYAFLARSGLRRIRLYDLRHTAATLLYSLKVDLKTIQEILRHAKLTTTMDVYTHVSLESKREALERMDRLIRPPKQGKEEA